MEKKYYVDYKKFARIYLFLPIFFYYWAYEPGIPQGEINGGVLFGTVAFATILHVFFVFWIKKRWYVTLRDEEFETFSMNGKRRTFRYDNLNAPMSQNIAFIVTLYLFSLRSDYKLHACVTDWVENSDECYQKIEEKRLQCEAAREAAEAKEDAKNDNVNAGVKEGDEPALPKKKSTIWGTVGLVAALAGLIYIKLQFLGG